MLAKAVQQHHPAPTLHKVPTLSQQLFPSSSPSASQEARNNATQRALASQSFHQIKGPNNVLRPSTSSALNGPRTDPRMGDSNLERRTTAQSSSASSLARHDSIFSRDSVVDLTQSSYAGGRVGKLHDAVYFDENDFDDDADLELDIEDPNTQGHLSASNSQQYLPTQKTTPLIPNGQPTSSVPVPWSSSPLQHKRTPPNAGTLQRGTAVPDLDASHHEQSPIAPPAMRLTKRRTMPWLDTDGQDVAQEFRQGPPPHVQKIIDRKRKILHPDARVETFTPLPKDKPSSPYPWNKTASAVKEEQKKLRQANKKLVKTLDGDGESIKQTAVSRRKSVARVFLSDEQKKVLNLVAEDSKSVFFTGSAGMYLSIMYHVRYGSKNF